MRPRLLAAATVLALAVSLLPMAACGGKPTSSTCDGVLIEGMLRDSLTNDAVSRASVALESGVQRSITPAFDFFIQQTVATDSSGNFSLCATAVTTRAIAVVTALDSSGKAYPPFITQVTGSTDLGTILMGGCRGTCGFEGQQQTSLPAVIDGVVTSTPVGKTGRVVPQFPMTALDGSPNMWGIAMPTFNGQAFTFSTVAGTCGGVAPFCAGYSFLVPSQQPVTRTSAGYFQNVAPPDYMMYAVADGVPSCTPPFGFTTLQQDGTLLTATPGVHLTASSIDLKACQ